MELETVNKLYLELSQFATATTSRELALMKELAEVKLQRDDLIADLSKAAPVAQKVPPIERDETMDRTYIPLPGGWEVQTKGSGSTFRVCDTKSGDRWPIMDCEWGFGHAEWERMAREIHAAAQAQEVRS